MNVDITFQEKPELATIASFKLLNLKTEKDFKETLAIIIILSADYYLDPEIGVEDLMEFTEQAKENNKAIMTLEISEEGLELEFLD